MRDSSGSASPIIALVVTYESSAVLSSCIDALRQAAPRRGVEIVVVDNASGDGSADLAERLVGRDATRRLPNNRGFAAGVNAVLGDFAGQWLAVVNPDVILPPGALDRLADVLESRPSAGLVGPRVRDGGGRVDRSIGHFPTLARERAHAMFLDRWLGREGRRSAFPTELAPVDWASGCLWLLRGEAVRAAGPLDEQYFMYFEDVDYCRRLKTAGYEVVVTPDVEVRHAIATGSAMSGVLPADGGGAPLLHYFRKFQPEVAERDVRRALRLGWRLRRALHGLRGRLGNAEAAQRARRYDLALRALEREPGAAAAIDLPGTLP